MPSIDLDRVHFESNELSQLFSFLKRTVQTAAPIHISGPAGVGKTTWAQWLMTQWPSLSVKEMDGREVTLQFFRRMTEAMSSGLICIENVDMVDLSTQKEIADFLEQRNHGQQIKVITTSRKKLRDLVAEEQFRLDLFCRLSVLQVELPSLKNIREEVLPVAHFYLRVFEILYKKGPLNFTDGAMNKLAQASWAGNFTELESVVERSVVLAQSPTIGEENIVFQFQDNRTQSADMPAGLSLSEMERRLILQTLKLTDQNRTKAAQILGISIRTLRNKLHEYKEAGHL